jgi:hypothetical protein
MFCIPLSSALQPDVSLWLTSARISIFSVTILFHWDTLLNTPDMEGILSIQWLRRLWQWAHQDLLLHDNASRRSAVNQQHRHWHPLNIPSNHIDHILQIWPHRTTLCSTKRKNHSAGEKSKPLMTWRELSATLCAVSPKSGKLPLSASYQRNGNSALTLVGSK